MLSHTAKRGVYVCFVIFDTLVGFFICEFIDKLPSGVCLWSYHGMHMLWMRQYSGLHGSVGKSYLFTVFNSNQIACGVWGDILFRTFV